MKVKYHRQVVEYLNELVDVLFEQEYFGFKESAYDYVDWILDRVTQNIATKPAKPAPEYFSRYGKNLSYLCLKRNDQTTWYVFFTIHEDAGELIYMVHYISNNHIVSQHL